MAVNDLHLCRSLLFLLASNPRPMETAKELPADIVILDLEDSVRLDDKAKAREMAVEALSAFEGRHVAVRINALGSEQFGEDVVAFRHARAAIVMPKAEDAKQAHDVGRLFAHHALA